MAETPLLTDPASAVIGHVSEAMRKVFTPSSSQPPLGGGSDVVRLMASDGIPLYAFTPHSDESDCAEPFLWVRLVARYRTDVVPTPSVSGDGCNKPVGLTVETGVGRCAVVELEPTWDDYARAAEVSRDDSWRVEMALCLARSAAVSAGDAIAAASDTIVPVGPEGGIFAWTGTIHFQL